MKVLLTLLLHFLGGEKSHTFSSANSWTSCLIIQSTDFSFAQISSDGIHPLTTNAPHQQPSGQIWSKHKKIHQPTGKTLRNKGEVHSANHHILPKNHGLGDFCGTFIFLVFFPLHPSSSLMAYLWRHHPPLVSSTFNIYGPATAAVASEPWQLGGSAK